MTISYHDVYQSTCFLRHFPQIFIRLIHKIPTSFNSNQPKTCIITDFSTVLYFLRKSHRRGKLKGIFFVNSPRPHNRIILGLAESSTTIIRQARFVRAHAHTHVYMCIYIHTHVCICTYILHVKSYIIHTHIYIHTCIFFFNQHCFLSGTFKIRPLFLLETLLNFDTERWAWSKF